MPVAEQAERAWRSRCRVAVWIAVLLAYVPFGQPRLPVQLPPEPLSAKSFPVAHEAVLAPAIQTPTRPQPERPRHRILPRVPDLAVTLTPLGSKPLPMRLPKARMALLLAAASTARTAEPGTRDVLDRSSVGTARTPTGPPSQRVLI